MQEGLSLLSDMLDTARRCQQDYVGGPTQFDLWCKSKCEYKSQVPLFFMAPLPWVVVPPGTFIKPAAVTRVSPFCTKAKYQQEESKSREGVVRILVSFLIRWKWWASIEEICRLWLWGWEGEMTHSIGSIVPPIESLPPPTLAPEYSHLISAIPANQLFPTNQTSPPNQNQQLRDNLFHVRHSKWTSLCFSKFATQYNQQDQTIMSTCKQIILSVMIYILLFQCLSFKTRINVHEVFFGW